MADLLHFGILGLGNREIDRKDFQQAWLSALFSHTWMKRFPNFPILKRQNTPTPAFYTLNAGL
jgi:hypothetical protein